MSCCGQGRAVLRQMQHAVDPAPIAADKSVARVLLRYQAQTPIAVRGVHTGRMYHFDGEHAQQHVEMGDAAAMMTSRFFARVD